MFKNYLLLALALLGPLIMYGQSDRIKNLEANLPTQTGLQFIADALKLSDWYRDEGFYDQAIEAAELAEEKADDLDQPGYEAKALTIAARAMMKKGGKRDWRKAGKNFNKSLELLGENEAKGIQLENILNLIRIAERRNKTKDVQHYEMALAKLKGEMPEEEITAVEKQGGFPLFGKKRRIAEAKLEVSESEKAELAETLAEINVVKDSLTDLQQDLNFTLATQRTAILTMTEEKAKTELLLAKKQHIVDSLNYIGIRDSFALARKEFLLKQQQMVLLENQSDLKIQKGQRNLFIALATLLVIVAFGYYSRFTNIKKHNAILETKNQIIREEQARSEELLLNILPISIANELKLHGFAQTRLYEQVTVLFIDFVGFSKIAKQLSPDELVANLNYCFKAFDQIIKTNGLEKIKTIGDAYMCAGGLPQPSKEHPIQVIRAALEVQRFLADWKLENVEKGEPIFEARVGIHTGEIIAGVVGDIKFAYDIWGDTVNVASRMETSGESGRVNISGTTYDLVKDEFEFEYRGKVPAKNMGKIDMYFVEE